MAPSWNIVFVFSMIDSPFEVIAISKEIVGTLKKKLGHSSQIPERKLW